MKVRIRGASPMSVLTWAEVSALPRPGDTVIIEDGEVGRAYTVTSVQFDLQPREAASREQERWLEETGIVVHVILAGEPR